MRSEKSAWDSNVVRRVAYDRRIRGHNQGEPTTLYIIECGGKVKIGIAASVAGRLEKLRPANPLPMTVAHERRFATRTEARVAERALHEKFGARRIHFEWFDVPVEEAVEAAISFTVSGSGGPVSATLNA